ncbi:PREDICTED: protein TRIGALACTOSYLDIACYLGLYCEROL 4, chloroplastic [Nicotiana attenuata]|uniref:Protein trigalactosyldiacylglycerol 4, chloroplastic n=1 Tax=Nicotiana attenuata TaxID=49451 RepID=A0A1J6J5C4_NICAT|nr:PREDICTED: protein TRIGALACTOSYLDIACYLGLYCEROL 4, chloroplastic [Nicotiana attenuata]OIT07864.1 protein trigalactosyldiacylglycerol 4, chloroplastic [Nicotiana attenuata]
MANMRTAMDAAFWDLNISTPNALDSTARSIPGEPKPLDGSKASRALRVQQLSLLGNGFPLGIIPSYSPTPNKELGSFALQSLLFKASTSNWWLGFIGQFRPKKLFSDIKAELSSVDEWELPVLKDIGKHFLEKSLYAFNVCSQLSLTPSSSLLLSTEEHGEKKGRRFRAMLLNKLPEHDVTLEAAWPELFIDHKGRYWEVPESISFDCSSLVSENGFRYRFGLHKNGGHPQAVDNITDEPPLNLMQGICGKVAFSYEKSEDLWRVKEKKEDIVIETDKGRIYRPSYDIRLREPHAAVSGIIGGTLEAWLNNDSSSPSDSRHRRPFGVDLFGSLCYTFQHGKFKETFGDLTRIDARLDVSSASALAKQVTKVFRKAAADSARDVRSSPRLELILQQQVAGPIVLRVDSKFLLNTPAGRPGVQLEDFICSLNYSLRVLQSGKVVAWYSPKRKEGMIELRLFEF